MQRYDYERNLADLQDKYGQDQATDAYAKFISQQRFKRQRDLSNQGFQRQFPEAVVGMNRGMGSRVRSGVFGSRLQNHFSDFNQNLGQLDQSQAAEQSQFELQAAQRKQAYQRALMLLQEQLAAGQVGESPFASYSSVYGNQ